jgi:hypothetical protein
MTRKSWEDVLNNVRGQDTPATFSPNPTLGFLQEKWAPYAPSKQSGRSGGGSVSTSEYAGAINQFMKAKQMAEELGTDSSGAGPDGLLDWVGRVLRVPQAAVFDIGSSWAKILGGRPEEVDDLGDTWNRIWNEQRGFGDTDLLTMRDEDSWWQTALKGGAAFVADTATDPLTYLTFGATKAAGALAGGLGDDVFRAGVGKVSAQLGEEAAVDGIGKMAANAAGRAVDDAAEAAAKASEPLADDVVSQMSRSGDLLSTPVNRQVAGAGDDLVEAGAQAGPNWGVLQQAQESFKSGLEAAYKTRGARGGQQYLIDTFGDDIGKQMWEEMPDALKGGVRLNNPLGFLMRDEYGLSKPLMRIDAGGRLNQTANNLGIDKAVDAAKQFSRRIPGVKWTGTHLGGRFGQQSWNATDAAFNAWKAGDGTARASKLMESFGELNGLRDAYRAHTKAMQIFAQDAAAVANDMAWTLEDEAVDEAAAKTFAKSFLADTARLETGPLDPGDVNEVAGHRLASIMRDFYTRQGKTMTDIDALDSEQFLRMTETDYMPRVVTTEGKERLRRQKKETPASGVGDSSAVKSRDELWARWERDPATGERRIAGWLTPEEVNEQVGYRMFEDDPVKAWAAYVNNTQKTVSAHILRTELVARGLLKDPSELLVSNLVPRREKLSDAALRLFRQADSARKVRQRGADLFEDMAGHYTGLADDLQRKLDDLLDGAEFKAQRAAGSDARRAESAGVAASEKKAEAATKRASELKNRHAVKAQELADARDELVRLRKQRATARGRATKAEARGAENAETLRKQAAKADERVARTERKIDDLEQKLPGYESRAARAAELAEEASKRSAREANSVTARRASEEASAKTLRGQQIKATRSALNEARRLAKQFSESSEQMRKDIEILAGTREGLEALIDPENLPRDPEELSSYFTALIDIVGGARPTKKSGKGGLTTIDKVLARKDLPAGTRQSLRELRDALADEQRFSSAGKLRDEVFDFTPPRVTEEGQRLKDLGWNQAGVDAPRDTAIPRSAFDNLWGPEAVRSFLETTYRVRNGDTGEFQRFVSTVYEPMISLFRQTATVGRGPGFALRNFYGGIWQNFAAGVSAQDMLFGIKYSWMRHQAEKQANKALIAKYGKQAGRFAVRERAELVEGYMKANGSSVVVRGRSIFDLHKAMEAEDVLSYNRTFNILSRNADDLDTVNIADAMSRRDTRSLFDGPLEDRAAWQRAMDFPISNRVSSRWFNANSRFNDSIEAALRAGAFANGYRRFGHDGAARMFANALHFDYSDLSEFERRVMRNFLPFYTWMRKNIPLQAYFLLHQPGRVNMLFRAQDTMKDVFGDKEADGLMPQWMRGNMFFETSASLGGLKVATGIESPLMDLNKNFKAPTSLNPAEAFGMVNLEAMLSNLNPIMRTGVEAYTGRSTVTGQEFRDAVQTPLWLGGGKLNGLLGLLPGVGTGVTEDGQAGINEFTVNALRSVLPFVSQGDRLIPTTDEGLARRPVTLVSNFLGLPVQTISPRQKQGVLSDYTKTINKGIEDYYAQNGISKDWVTLMKQKGYSESRIAFLIDAGFGRDAPTKKAETVKTPLRLD